MLDKKHATRTCTTQQRDGLGIRTGASKQSSLIAGSGPAARQSEWGAAARRPHRHAPGAVPNASPNATETHRTCLSSRVGGLALHAVPAQMPGRVGGASSIKQRSITENKA